MEETVVKHYTENSKYRIKIEKAAGVKTGDGFCIEANGDVITAVEADAQVLYDAAKTMVAGSIPGNSSTEIKEK